MENKKNWRLTTDRPEANLGSLLNLFYVKDRQAWVRGGGPGPEYPDCSLNDFARRIVMQHALSPYIFDDLTDEQVSEVMAEWLSDGVDSLEGIVGTLYAAGWAFAELRERLKLYEDAGIAPDSVNAFKWTPADKHLPDLNIDFVDDEDGSRMQIEVSVFVWCYVQKVGPLKGRYERGPLFQGWVSEKNVKLNVTHWMPLPTPPEVGIKEDNNG